MIPNNTVIAKGGDFNITGKQTVPILFDDFSKREEKESDQTLDEQCKSECNYQSFLGEKHVLIINVRHNNLVFYLLITGKNNSIPSSSESNDEKPEGSGNNQTNHENVLDMETKNNMSMTKSSLIRKMDSILSALPICRDIPSRIHVEV